MTHANYHTPVLLNEAVRHLVTDPDGIYVDSTLGGGGHSAQILQKLSGIGHLYAIDQDEEALSHCVDRFKGESRITFLRGNFGYLDVLLPREHHGFVNGILLDLGVSSHQIDKPGRGFSFQHDGPLDMRMGSLQGRTAADVVNEYEYEPLRDLLFKYGEERHSARIARAIIQARPVTTTAQLRDVIATVVPERFRNKSFARIFQALRIEVNSELKMLERVLEKSQALLCDSGRMVVISYHSLEDRLCKNFFRYGNFEGKPVKDFFGNDISPMTQIDKKVITASEDEISENPRARSARLRAAFKNPVHEKNMDASTGHGGGTVSRITSDSKIQQLPRKKKGGSE